MQMLRRHFSFFFFQEPT